MLVFALYIDRRLTKAIDGLVCTGRNIEQDTAGNGETGQHT
jgi:hypothetical protein